MKRLINLNIKEAKDVICFFSYEEYEHLYKSGEVMGFIIPNFFAIGVFSDGTAKIAGIRLEDVHDLQYFNCEEMWEFFTFDHFCDYVDDDLARAFVKGKQLNENWSEERAKDYVYEQLSISGVRLSNNAKHFLHPRL